MQAADARTERELQMLEAMVDCSHALGMAIGRAALAETDVRLQLQFHDAFLHCFQGVRLGIRLRLALRAAPKTAQPLAEAREPSEAEPAETERPERERGDWAERDRERDYEPVSLPKFLATLGAVAAEARGLQDHLPDDVRAGVLPTLDDLLARAKAEPAHSHPRERTETAPDLLVRSPPAAAKARLMGSTSAPLSPPTLLGRPGLPRPPPRAPG